MSTENRFITVPSVTLPNGIVAPSFQVGQFLCSPGELHADGAKCRRLGDRQPRQAAVTAEGYPWTSINYRDAQQALAASGFQLITELQALAIAFDIAQQDINWTGGTVGEGALYQGLHQDSVDCAMPGNYTPADDTERRWHQLSNGERIYDFAGNAFTWIFDNVQGDAEGLVAKAFAEDSPSLTTAPFPSEKRGTGWRPAAGRDWSGRALLRGGCWHSGSYAGAFCLCGGWPVGGYGDVGFRCTKPGL